MMELVAVLHKMGGCWLVGFANACRQQRYHPGHGIVELLWLEKTSKIKNSSHQPNSTKCPDKLWVEMLSFTIPPFSDSVVATSFLIYFELLCPSSSLFPLSVVV